jgi:RNA polymerase sigma-70 factor (ECF subfamily)
MSSADIELGSVAENKGLEGQTLNLSELQSVFAQMRGELLRFLTRRTGNPATAADLSQDVFEKLSSIGAEIPDHQKARSYLFRMAGNLAIDHRRVEARRAEILEGSQVLFEDVTFSPEAIAVSRDQLRRLEEALAELPAKVREVLVLARMHGLSHREVASRLGVSVSLVEKYQLKALMHCRERMGDIF